MDTSNMTLEKRKEYRAKIKKIAEKCVWYTSATWNRYKETKKRTSFNELNKNEKSWYLMVAENGLEYCTKWKFNPMAPFIINTVVYPVYLFKPTEERRNYDRK